MGTPLNTEYFTNLTTRVNNASSCADLQAAVNDAFASINSLNASIAAAQAILGPMEALLTAPASNPGAIVTWIESLITDYLTPQLVSIATLAAQATAMTAAIASLTAAITTKAESFVGCDIIIPT